MTIGLVHVVYAPYGTAPLRWFLESYRKYPAGIDHELILVFKAFVSRTLPEEYHTMLDEVPHRALFVADGGFDLGSYFFAAKTCEHEFLCFLNSRSVILADGWLAKLHAVLATAGGWHRRGDRQLRKSDGRPALSFPAAGRHQPRAAFPALSACPE